MSLRALAEQDLGFTLEGVDWAADVRLIPPDGVPISTTLDGKPLRGQVLYNVVRQDPMSGERIVADTLVVTVRRSSLRLVPQAGENWIVEVPVSPRVGAPVGQYALTPTRPPEGGAAIGFIRLYLQTVEQTPDEEELV